MTETGQTGPSTDGDADGEDAAASRPEVATPGESTSEEPSDGTAPGDAPAAEAGDASAASPAASATDDDDDIDALADQEDRAYRAELRKGLLVGLGGGLVVGLLVALVLGALVWPGYLLGPGSPDDTALRATTALAGKDAAALDQVSCRARTGQTTTQIPAQALQLVSQATASGPTTQTLDNEARVPVDLVLAGGGQAQTQTLPIELVLNVNDGSWCLNGIAQRQ